MKVDLTVINGIIIAAVLMSYFFIWLIIKSPLINLFRDKPGLRKVHQRVIPRIGGIAILCGFLLFLFVWHYAFPSLPQLPSNLLSAFTFAACAIMLVGLADDMIIFQIHNKAKFILEILIASEIVFLNGIQLHDIHILNWDFSLGWMGIPITILWIVGVTNAINIIDGLDGLAGSVMVIVFATIAVLTGFSSNGEILVLCVILLGLIGGFLIHNISPARVFLGDTGSLFLGIITGVLSIYLVSNNSGRYPILVAPLIVGLPVLDVFVAMARRFMKKVLNGTPWFKAFGAMSVADNEHMHHRLVYRGLTHTETVSILLLFHSVICMSAIMITFTDNVRSIAMLLYISILGIWFLYKLHFFDRFANYLKHKNPINSPKLMNIMVVNAADILKYSLSKYKQDIFSFSFYSSSEALENSVKCGGVIIEQDKDFKLEDTIALASAIFMQYTCPVIVISADNEEIPEHLQYPVSGQGSYLLLKKPIYTPVLMRELSRLIRQSRGWSMEKVTTDTRQFFLQAMIHEEI